MKGKNILVTGSAGFLGSNLCKRLVSLGCNVIGVDNFAFANKWTHNNGLIFKEIDITSAEQVHTLFKEYDFDVVFHLAAVANPRTCKENFDLAFNVNVTGTKNVLACSNKRGHVIFMSSAAVYGEPLRVPIDEKHPLRGNDPYAVTKIMGENLCFNFSKNYGLRVSIARNFNTFGVGQTGDYIIPTLIRQALKRGKIEIWNSNPVRDLTYVDNTVDALVAISEFGEPDIYNVGRGIGIKIGELANILKNSIDPSIEITDLQKPVSGSPVLVADNKKLKTLGWTERVGFEDGLSKTIEWYKSTCS